MLMSSSPVQSSQLLLNVTWYLWWCWYWLYLMYPNCILLFWSFPSLLIFIKRILIKKVWKLILHMSLISTLAWYSILVFVSFSHQQISFFHKFLELYSTTYLKKIFCHEFLVLMDSLTTPLQPPLTRIIQKAWSKFLCWCSLRYYFRKFSSSFWFVVTLQLEFLEWFFIFLGVIYFVLKASC